MEKKEKQKNNIDMKIDSMSMSKLNFKIMSDTGRFFVKVGNRTFCVEPIDNNVGKRKQWGDIDPVTKKTTGNYGEKSRGAIHEADSIITEENGYKNITMLPPGTSPMGYIDMLLQQENLKT